MIKTADFSISGTWTDLGSGLKYITEGFYEKTQYINKEQFESEYLNGFLNSLTTNGFSVILRDEVGVAVFEV